MRVQFLVYNGGKESGSLIVRNQSPTSPWRKLKYYKGMRLKVGKDVPLKVALFVASTHSLIFSLEEIDIPTASVLKDRFVEIINSYKARFEEEEAEDIETEVVSVCCSALVEVFGETVSFNAMRAFKEISGDLVEIPEECEPEDPPIVEGGAEEVSASSDEKSDAPPEKKRRQRNQKTSRAKR